MVGRAVFGLLLVIALVAGTSTRTRAAHARDREAHLDATPSARPSATRFEAGGAPQRRAPRTTAEALLVPTYTWVTPPRGATVLDRMTPPALAPGRVAHARHARGPPSAAAVVS